MKFITTFFKKYGSKTAIKNILTGLFFLTTLFAHAQTPVAYYPFNGNANDAAGSNHGTVNGATLTTDRFGNANSAYSFDGVDDNIDISNDAVFNFSSFTISVWFKYNGSGTAGKSIWSLISKNANGNGFDDAFHLWINATTKETGGRVGNGSSEFYLGNPPAIDNAQWHQSALVFDNLNDIVTLYLDGAFNSSVTNNSNPFNNGGDIKIGFWEAFNNFFNGSIDEVKIYNTALTAAQVLAEFSAIAGQNYRSKQTGNWSSPSTWEVFNGSSFVPATVAPSSTDGVITIRNGHTVTVNSTVNADQLVVEGDGFLTVASTFSLADGPGDDLTVDGTINFQSGTIVGPGNVVVESTGIMAIITANSKILEANITNHGVINWNDGVVSFSSNPVITNHGTWNLNGNYNTSTFFTTGSIINSGSIIKNSSGTSTIGGLNTFTNTGNLVLNSGILSFNTGTFNNSGNLSFNGGTLNTSSSFVLNYNTGSVMSGSGIFTNGGTFKINIDLTVPSTLNFSNTGTIDGNGNLTINNDFSFSGTVKGNGFLQLNENATWNGGVLARLTQNVTGKTLTLTTSNTKNLDASLTNNGNLDWQGGNVAFSNTPTITNNGSWIISGNNSTTTWFTSGNIVNNGTINKTSSGTTTLNGIITFDNHGTFNLNAGTVLLNSGTCNNNGNLLFNTGILSVGISCTLNHNSGSVINGTGSFTNAGTFKLNIDQVFPSSLLFSNTGTIEGNGNLTVNNDFTFSGQIKGSGFLQLNENAVWNGGNLARVTQQNAGKTLTLAGTNTKNLDAHLTVNGTLDWQGGTIAFSNTPTLTNNGSWIINGNNTTTTWFSNGNIANAGTITKTSTGTTTFAGITSFENPGTINLNAGTVLFNTGTYNNTGNLLFNNGILSTGSSATLNHNAGSVIDGTGSFSNAGTFKLNINQVFPSSLIFSNTGTIDGIGNLTVNNDFTFSGQIKGSGFLQLNENAVWNGGNLARVTQQNAGKTLTLAGTNTKNLDAHLTVNGTLDWQGGTIAFSNTPTLTNNGFWIINGNSTTTTWFSNGNIVNAGTITKTSTGTTTFAGITSFENSGTINLNAGTVLFNTGTYNNAGNLTFNTGILSTGISATLNHNPGSVISGTGSFSNAGTFKLNINQIFPATLIFSNTGTIDGTGNLTLNNDFSFSGIIKGSGSLFLNENATWNGGELVRPITVLAGKSFTLATNTTKHLNTSLISNGILNWLDGTIAFSNTPTLTNNGTWNISGNNTTTTWFTNGNIVNNGTINKTSTGTTTFNGVTSFVNQPSAYMKGVGTIAMGATTFTNNGLIKPGNSPGILIFNNQQPLSASSTLEVELLDNSGPGTGHSQLQRNANLTLNGTLKIVDTGNVPDGTYTIISLASGTITGNFSSTDMPAGFSYQVSGTNVSIIKNTATIACPNSRTVTAPTGQCTAQVFNLDPVIEEGQPYSYNLSGATTGSGNGSVSGLFFNAGVTTVTYTMTNNPQNFCSFSVTVNTNVTPSVFITASSTSICPGDEVVFTATPSNGGTPFYQWKLNGENVGTNSNIFEMNTLVNGDVVTVSMTSSLFCANPATVNSNSVTITVNPDTPPAVSISASATTVCQGQTVSFTATPVNAVSPSYQWKVNGQNAGSNNPVFSVNTLNNGDVVSVVLTTSAQCASPNFALSNEIIITVPDPIIPAVTIEASATEICAGTPVTFMATPQNGGNPTYQWKVNGINAGNNSPVFATSSLQADATVTVEMYSDLTCAVNPAISNSIQVTVNPLPVVTIAGSNQFCEGSSTTLTASAGVSWMWNTGATTQSITANLPGTYSVTVTNSFGCTGSATFTVLPFPAPTGAFSLVAPADSTYGVQEPVSFSWTPAANATTYDLYIWRTNQQKPLQPTVADITGTTFTYTEYLNKNFIYLWQVTAHNLCSQSESQVRLFSFYVFTDLTSGNETTPATALAGTTIPVSFTITNTGSVGTGIIPWKDAVYLSTQPEFDAGSAILLATPNNLSALAPGQSYTNNLNITIPQFIEGEYYVFVRTDLNNIIQETDETNNISRSTETITVTLPPYPDIAVTGVQSLSGNIIPGENLTVGWNVQNLGNASAVGGWSQRISIMNGTQVFIIGYLPFNGILEPNGIISQSSTVVIPELPGFDGEVFLQVRLTPNSGLIEKPNGTGNNTALSDQTYQMEKRMFITLSPQTIPENSASPLQGMIYRSGNRSQALTVSLTPSEDGRITIPSSVHIPTNQSGAMFQISAINNSIFEGNIDINILAAGADYPHSNALLTIVDDEIPGLSMILNKTSATEGENFQLTLTRSFVSGDPLIVTLTASKPNQIDLPASLEIPANEASKTIDLMVKNNTIPEITEEVTIHASVVGYSPVSAAITLLDDDIPQIALTLDPAVVTENSGPNASWGTVQLAQPAAGNIVIQISANVPGQLIFPAQVTIPNGQAERQFIIGVVDNALLDGNRDVEISAAVFIPSCGCGAPSGTGGATTQTLSVLDNDGPALSVSVNPFVVPENVTDAGTLTITRNTPGGSEIFVNIAHNGPAEVQIQSTITMPEGATSLTVPFNTLDDGIEDGSQIVSVTVSAQEYSSGSCWIMVSDRNLPDFVVKEVSLSKSSVFINETMEISVKVVNEGFALAPDGVEVKLFRSADASLDNSDVLITTLYTPSVIGINDSLVLSSDFIPADVVGNFFIIARVNGNGSFNELITINNSSSSTALTIIPDYTATVSVAGVVFNGSTPIIITGVTETNSGTPAPDKAVDVYLLLNGTRRVLNAVSDNTGQFSVSFVPVNGEAGFYQIGACYPGQGLSEAQDTFKILGARANIAGNIFWDMHLNETRQFSLEIENYCDLPLTGLNLEMVSAPPGCTINATSLPQLDGNGVATLNYSVTSNQISIGNYYHETGLQLTSAEGTKFRFNAWYYSRATKGNLKLEPVSLNKGMVTGVINYVEFVVRNNGMAETGNITVQLPQLSWLSLANESNIIPSLEPGQAAAITLRLTPGDDLPLNNPITGQLTLSGPNADGVALPFVFEPISVETGSLLVDVVNEYTYNTAAAPHLEGATVVVTHPYTGRVIAQGITDVNGHFTAENINEGYYNLRVEAPRHNSYYNSIYIEKGRVNSEEIFIGFNAITYSWQVVPTLIEDEYEINLLAEFETNVPAPVLRIDKPKNMPSLGFGGVYPFIISITNLGLITARDVEIELPVDDEYIFVVNANMFDLMPQTTIQIPAVMQRIPAAQSSGGAGKCVDYMVFKYKYACGPGDQRRIVVDEVKYADRYCAQSTLGDPICLDCIGFPAYHGGGAYFYDPYPFSIPTTPNKKVITSCNPCFMDGLNFFFDNAPIPMTFGFSQGKSPNRGSVGFNTAATAMEVGGEIKEKLGDIGDAIELLGLLKCEYDYQKGSGGAPGSGGTPARGGKEPEKGLVPQEIIVSMADINMFIKGLRAADTVLRQVYANETLLSKDAFSILNDSIIDDLTSFTIIPQDRVTSLINLFSQTEITQDEITGLTNRWNTSMEAWSLGIVSPSEDYPDIADSLVLYQQALHFDTVFNYLVDRGFVFFEELYNNPFGIMKSYTERPTSSVCATVTVQFSQTLTMTREAFEGTLTIFNGHETDAMENVKLELEIRDESGTIRNDLFQINTKSLSQLTGIDGSGTLDAMVTGSAVIQFIPERGAAPDVSKFYSFGGTLSYIDPFTQELIEQPLFPVTLQVNPSPDLYIDYFMQRDILGDDALTTPVEPMIPAELAVMIDNRGAGKARSVNIESAQPQIIENEKGLEIDFTITASSLSGKPLKLGLLNIDFGDIEGGKRAIGQWWFTSTLLGHFIAYEVSVNHSNSFGNPDLSLVSEVNVHELIKSVSVYGPLNDTINDFLVNNIPDADDIPDALYYSNGPVAPVYNALNSETDGMVTLNDLSVELTVTPSLSGWNYTRLNDPGNGFYRIVSCVRDDGQEIPLDNIWLTHVTIPDGGEPIYENKLHFLDIFDDGDPVSYTIVWEAIDMNIPTVTAINGIPESGLIEYPLANLEVVFNKPIDASTFDHQDIILKNQGGPNLSDSTLVVTQINDTVFDINFGNKTQANGFYVLTVQAAGISDLIGNYGVEGRQASWIQVISTPAIDYFFGLPEDGQPTDTLLVLFNMPINISTFSNAQLILTDPDGNIVPTGSLVISGESFNNVLFKISGLQSLASDNGTYTMTFLVTEILGETGQVGLLDQTIEWTVCQIPLPVAGIGPDATVCIGESYPLSGSVQNAGGFAWATSGSGTFDDPGSLTPVYTPSQADITSGSVQLSLIVQPMNTCAAAVTASMILSIENAVHANAGIDATICQNTTHQLFGTVDNASGFRWISSGNGTFSSASSLTAVYTPGTEDIAEGSVTLSLIADPLSPCILADTSNMILTIQQLPTAFAGTNFTVCEGQPVQLNGSAQHYSSVLWVGGGSGTLSNRTILNPVYTFGPTEIERGFVTFLLMAEATSPCFTRAYSTLRIDLVKQPLANAGSNATICENQTHLLSGSASNCSIISWSTSGDGTFSSTSSLTPVYTPGSTDIFAGSVVLTLTALPASPCLEAAYSSKTLTTQKSPEAYAGTGGVICENQSFQLNGTVANAQSFQWQTSGDGSFSNNSILNPVYTPGALDIQNGLVTLTLVANANSPCFEQVVSSVSISIQPLPLSNAGSNATLCENQNIQLTGTVANAASYFWSTSGDGTFSSTSSLTPVYTPGSADILAGSVILTLTAQSLSPCAVEASSEIELVIYENPVAAAGDDATICEGDSHQLNGSVASASAFFWQSSGDGSFDDSQSLLAVYTPGTGDLFNGTVILTLTASPLVPCSIVAESSMTLSIQPLPEVNAGEDGEICHYNTFSLSGFVQHAQSFLWSTNGDGTLDDAGSLNTTYTPGQGDISAGSAVLTLSATPISPCTVGASDQITLQINYCHDLVIPSGWSGLSTFVNPLNPAIEDVFRDVVSDLVILQSLTGIYWPGQNINTIGNWSVEEGYSIKVANQVNLTIAGSRSANAPLALSQGWNLIPVLSECEADVAALFEGKGVIVVKEVAGWQLYWPQYGLNTLQNLQPGKAYFVLMSQPASVLFPGCVKSGTTPGVNNTNQNMTEMISASPWNSFCPTPNAHMIAIPQEVISSSLIRPGDYLGAFDQNGNCFGLIRWEGNNASLALFADDPTTSAKDGFTAGEKFNLRMYLNSTGKEYSLDITWDQQWPDHNGSFSLNGISAVAGLALGTTQVNELSDAEVVIYPNPASDYLFVDLVSQQEIEVVMTDMHGREVLTTTLTALRSQLDISTLRKGIYLLKLENEGLRRIEKIVVR